MEDREHTTLATRRIAYFVSPHGYGHAARSSAIMAAIQERLPPVRFEIFTQVPRWFFAQSLTGPFGYHALLTDIGLIQKNPLSEDLPATIDRLNHFLPFDRQRLSDLARQLDELECDIILCDIAPLGIAAARQAGLPAILIENFTWDWIYAGYPDYEAQLSPHMAYLQELFELADYHIQTEPICLRRPADLVTPPVSRKIRSTAAQVRAEIGAPAQAPTVLITMGGMDWDNGFLRRFEQQGETTVIVASNNIRTERRGSVIRLARNSGIFHPDLVNACDALIGKTGYSTLAEVYQAGLPFGYISRPEFRESRPLEAFIGVNMPGLPFTEAQLWNGTWFSRMQELLALPRTRREASGGADQIAEFICNLPALS